MKSKVQKKQEKRPEKLEKDSSTYIIKRNEFLIITLTIMVFLSVIFSPDYTGFQVFNDTNHTGVNESGEILDIIMNTSDGIDVAQPIPGIEINETTNTTEIVLMNDTNESDETETDIELNLTEANETTTNITIKETNATTETNLTNITTNPTTNLTINLTTNETNLTNINLTDVNQTAINLTNLTNATTTNETIQNLSLIQGEAEVGKPVKWTRIVQVNAEDAQDIRENLPKGADNVKVYILGQEDEEVVADKQEKDKGLTIEFSAKQGVNPYKIEYETPGPSKHEEMIGGKKRVVISSKIHYTNVKAWANIDPSLREDIALYWVKEEGRELVTDWSGKDNDGDGLVERIEWTVPHLSNQTYEIEFIVLNLHSYPGIGKDWKVEFNTSGTADLRISGLEGTSFGEMEIDNNLTEDDLGFMDVGCGETSLKDQIKIESEGMRFNPEDIEGIMLKVDAIIVENYSCTETGYFMSEELSGGRHVLLFEYGPKSGKAENFATKLLCDVSTSCAYTEVLHMSRPYNAHAELVNNSNYNYTVCCRELSGEAVGTDCSDLKNESLLRLANETNSHVERRTESNYQHEVCINPSSNYNITCNYVNTTDCVTSGYDTCLFSISTGASGGPTNLHIAGCGEKAYDEKMCCGTDIDIVCIDNDGDGAYGGASNPACGITDCDDTNASIRPPEDDLVLKEDTWLCGGTWHLNDSGAPGVIKFGNSDITVECLGTTIIGNGSGTGAFVGHRTDVLKGCTFRNYTEAVLMGNIWNWTHNPTSLSDGDDALNDVTTDSEDNIIVVGRDSSESGGRMHIIKFNARGERQWNWTLNPSTGSDALNGVTVDSQDNIIAVGYDSSPGDAQFRVVKLDPDGGVEWQWTNNPTPSDDTLNAVAVDVFDNIYAAGNNATHFWILKLDSTATEVWNWTYDTGGSETFNDIAIDSNGNVIAAGYDTVPGNSQFHVVKLTSGLGRLWNWTYNPSSGTDFLSTVAIDNNDDIIVGGRNYVSGALNYQQHIVKLNTTGGVVWNYTNDTSPSLDAIYGLAVDDSDNIYAGGLEASLGDTQFYITKLNSSGNQTSDWSYNPGPSQSIYGVAIDTNDNVVFAGIMGLSGDDAFYVGRLTSDPDDEFGDVELFNNSFLNSTYGIYADWYGENGTVRNNSVFQNEYGIYLDDDMNELVFYYNNISYSGLYHAYAEAAGNHFNTTNGSSCGANCSRGNYWSGVKDLFIADFNGDGFGDTGDEYPYNSTNNGNVSMYVQDEGPITPSKCIDYDGDGLNRSGGSSECGTGDCNDYNAAVYPPYDGMNITQNTVFCPGVFTVPDPGSNGLFTSITGSVTIRGNNTRIEGTNGATGRFLGIEPGEGVVFRDMNVTNYSRNIIFSKGDDISFDNMTIGYAALYNFQVSNTNNLRIINSKIYNASSVSSILLNRANNTLIENNTINDYAGDAITADTSFAVTIRNNTIDCINKNGFGVHLQGDSYADVAGNETKILDNTIRNCDRGIRSENTATVNNVTINNNTINNSVEAIMILWKSSGWNISSNTITYATDGLRLSTTASSNNSIIHNNTFAHVQNGVLIQNESSQYNLFYYNNFTDSSLYHASVAGPNNYFNTTNGSSCGAYCARGNYWDDIDAIDIYDTNGDGFGEQGVEYPYDSSVSSKVTSNVVDYGPITDRDGRIEAPVLISPPDEDLVTDSRNPHYFWFEVDHTLTNNLYYDIQVDNDPGFGSPEVDVKYIAEDGGGQTDYWDSNWLDFYTSYYWRVRANDTLNISDWSTVWNYTIMPTVSCTATPGDINFGSMSLGEENDTTNYHPAPYLVENSGNVKVNITVNGTYPWTSSSIGLRESDPGNTDLYYSVPNKLYQFRVDQNETNAYIWALDDKWYNMTNSTDATLTLYGGNWSNESDQWELEIRLQVPTDEPSGVKNTNTYIICQQNETI